MRVNAVAPGYVHTPALDPALALGFVEAQRLAQASALGRLATAREVADAVTFLASDAAPRSPAWYCPWMAARC